MEHELTFVTWLEGPDQAASHRPQAADFKDPRGIDYTHRAISYYPLSNGRNFPEIRRLLQAMLTSDTHKVATPADWQPGEEVIVPPPGFCGEAKERVESTDPSVRCVDWFLCFKKLG